jgi:hypothetical protein
LSCSTLPSSTSNKIFNERWIEQIYFHD